MEEWLAVLKLSEYNATLQRQGYRTPMQMLQVMWEDLEEMGITRLGHQKKVSWDLEDRCIITCYFS